MENQIESTTKSAGNEKPVVVAKNPEEAQKLVLEVNALIAKIRLLAIEPMSLRYTDLVDIEIRPSDDDERVIVGHQSFGFCIANFTHEGLILDVCSDTGDSVMTASVLREDLETLPE